MILFYIWKEIERGTLSEKERILYKEQKTEIRLFKNRNRFFYPTQSKLCFMGIRPTESDTVLSIAS